MGSVLWRLRTRRQSVSYAFCDMHKDAPAHCEPQPCSPPPSLAPCASSTSYECRGGTAIPTTTQVNTRNTGNREHTLQRSAMRTPA
ncbi:hypothetical protein VTO73DRAFT_10886 [Trametes versicolor]